MGFDILEFDVNDLVIFLQLFDSFCRKLLSEIFILGKLLFVLLVINVVSERLFLVLKWVKMYLCLIMGDFRLNYFMMLYVYKDRIDVLIFVDVVNDFVGEKEN